VAENAMTQHADDCPDPETIGAYLEGRLSGPERARITEHLSTCDACYFAFTEAAQTHPAEAGEKPSWWHAWLVRPNIVWSSAAALATAAALVIAIGTGGFGLWRSTQPPELRALVAAVGTDRTVEARLSGGFAYGPLRAPVRAGEASGTPVSPDVRIAAAQIEKVANASRTPRNLAALGVALLVTGRPADAVNALENATRDAPDDGRLWSDLSAAYLSRAKRGGSADDLVKAVDAADLATRLAPSMNEGWFNRALAIEQIGGLRDEAKKAWQLYLDLDPDSEWGAEARRHLTTLSGQSRGIWDDRRHLLRQEVVRPSARAFRR
jgi:tetratricopeptide (TPR) repeat protein